MRTTKKDIEREIKRLNDLLEGRFVFIHSKRYSYHAIDFKSKTSWGESTYKTGMTAKECLLTLIDLIAGIDFYKGYPHTV